MIEKVGLSYTFKIRNNLQNQNNNKSNSTIPNDFNNSLNLDIPFYHPISFGANKKSSQKHTPLEVLEYCYTNSATNLVNDATKLAMENKNSEVTHFHIWKAELNQLDKYIDDLNNGTKQYDYKSGDSIQSFLEVLTTNDIFRDEKVRIGLQKLIKDEKTVLDNIILKLPKDEKVTTPKLSDEVVRDIWSPRESENERVYDFNIVGSALYSEDDKVKEFLDDFIGKINNLTMINHDKIEERSHIKAYDEKAKNIWKNLALGTNMFVTFDHKKVNPYMFINSLYYTKSEDTDITQFEINIKE